ncbi:MAG TPA: GNAT family N-acetyltransferase [Chitinophagaceae bacterium]|nr:GNAT family N-acetyltransferase [Chitinophagaceae bacterium]MCB9056653.1 GNAT family N-acetyltransferase [Chitinophagales bacterium]HPG12152.1 GNAT family N-acetyltransferase [Chitinophagaceae bacterium]HRX93806.1 GNAT family N-acetyltransferase [Chitinophagaceae bacterium]
MPVIKAADTSDVSLIRNLALQIWPPTYSHILSPEQIEYMLDMMYSESSLKEQMQKGSHFVLVYTENEPVGFAAYIKTGNNLYKLDKIYVLSEQQGKGIGKQMIDHVTDIIKNQGATALQLQVNRNNKARQFYEKLGFSVLYEKDFPIGNGFVMDDYVMEKKL